MIFGSADGLGTADDEVWTQDTSGVADAAEAGDRFGAWLATGDFSATGVSSLVVGVPEEDQGEYVDAGIVHELPGGPGGVSAADDRVWSEASPGIPGQIGNGDGWAVVAGASP